MAWADHPQWRQGWFWLLNPTAVFQASLDRATTWANGYVSGAGIIQYLYVIDITLGALTDLQDGMTLCLGSAAGLRDYGWCRVRGVTNVAGTDVILVWVSEGGGVGEGELTFGTPAYITVYNDYRMWSKPPYFDDDGTGWFDGYQSNGVGGVNYNHPPVAVMGEPVMDWVDPATGLLTVNFDWSKSYRVEHTAALGAWGADISGTATMTASSTNGTDVAANTIDNNVTTYWQPTADPTPGSPQWLKATYASAKKVLKYTITASGLVAPKDWTLELDILTGVSGLDVIDTRINETGWGTNETRTYYCDIDWDNELWGSAYDAGHTVFRLNFTGFNGGAALRVKEVEFFEEDRATAYGAECADGTITVGSATSETLTVTFPPGFRYVKLMVTDSNGYTGFHHLPVVALAEAQSLAELSYVGATITASTQGGGAASRAFDGSLTLVWQTSLSTPTGWVQAQLAAAKRVSRYGVQYSSVHDVTAAPKDWTLEASNTGAFAGEEVVLDTRTAQTGWSASEERAFDIASPGVYLYYRLDVTANNGFNSLVVAELNLYNSLDAYLPLDNVEITSQTLEPEGQTLDVIVRESLSAYPDNTLCMYIEDEYYAGVKGAVAAAGPAGRRQLKFWGWVASQELRVFGDDTARRTETVLHCVDPGQRLRALPAWNMMWLRKYSPNYSYEMRHPNMDRLIWFAMRYLSTACEVTDFRWSGTLEQYGVGVMAAYGESVYDLADFCAVAPSMRLTSNKFGKLQVKLDPILFSMLAISTHVALTEDDYTEFNWTHDKNSQYHWAWESALATQNQDWDSGGFAITTHFAVSPGKAPGQGVQTVDLGEQIVSSFWGTTELAFRAGNRYASRLNPDDANATLTLAHGNDGGIDPAEMLYLTLTLGAAYAPVTGQTFTTQKFWPTRLTIEHNNEASLKTVRLDLEQCILGEVATAYTPPA